MEISKGNGGLHGALKNVTRDDVYLIDVVSFYPSIMVNNPDLLPRCRYKYRYSDLLEMKFNGLNEIKLLLNKVYGLNDPEKREKICKHGQSIMTDLIERVGGELIQVNTDGIIVKNPRKDAIKMWETINNMRCKITHLKRIVQKDINNYCALLDDGKTIKKGAILNHRGIQYDSIVRYLLEGIPIREGITRGQLIDYCIIQDPAESYQVGEDPYIYECDCVRYVYIKNGSGLVIDGKKVAESALVLMGELQNYDDPDLDYSTYTFMAKQILDRW